MNKRIVITSLTFGILSAFIFASTTSAFWPFDALFKKTGDVKAVKTDKMYRPETEDTTNKLARTLKSLIVVCDDMYNSTSDRKPQPGEVDPSTGKVVAAQNGNTGVVSPKKATALQNSGNEKFNESGPGVDARSILPSSSKPAPLSKELEAINAALKARCENIRSINARMLKIVKIPEVTITIDPTRKPMPTVTVAGTTCGGIRGTRCPEGYTCEYKTKTGFFGKADATGICVSNTDPREYKIN